MMKIRQYISLSLMALAVLVLSSCPSPTGFNTGQTAMSSESTASVEYDVERGLLVFTDEDGAEIPVLALVNGSPDGPVELIDYAVIGTDSDLGRHAGSGNRVRCVIVGRRSDGRSGLWIIYRSGGVVVLPNEDGIEDSALMELVEAEGSPFLGEGWVYDARAISDDGRIIIGQLSRPDGWEYVTGDYPEPEIGVWWTIREAGPNLVVSRARPILKMRKPGAETVATHRFMRRHKEWIDMLIEWLGANILEHAWNYLADAESFVDPSDVEGGIPAGQYVVAGPDKSGTDAWAWITPGAVKTIVDAPDQEPGPDPHAPYPVIGPEISDLQSYSRGAQEVVLELDSPDGSRDPDGDTVTYSYTVVSGEDDFLALYEFGLVQDPDVLKIELISLRRLDFEIIIRIDATDSDGNTTQGADLLLRFTYSPS